MHRFLKILGIVLLAVVAGLGLFLAYVAVTGIPKCQPGRLQARVEVTPEKVERGRKYAQILCASCHQNPTTRTLTGKRLGDLPPEFGVVYSKNITQDSVKGIT